MKCKPVTVLDDMTKMNFLVLKFDEKDEIEALDKAGWSEHSRAIILLSPNPGIAMGSFRVPSYDLKEFGNGIPINRTTLAFASYIRDTSFEEISTFVDVTP